MNRIVAVIGLVVLLAGCAGVKATVDKAWPTSNVEDVMLLVQHVGLTIGPECARTCHSAKPPYEVFTPTGRPAVMDLVQ